jgi:uncharacterized protein (TIGR03435 family)
MRLRSICIPTIVFALAAAEPQNAVTATPIFEVAAIHPHESQPHEHNSIWSSPDGHFLAENISILALIHWAYEMPETRILNIPAWTESDHFNIEAKADPAIAQTMRDLAPDVARRQKELMVQALLADRFQLVAHLETRERPIYELVVAKKGAILGDLQSSGSTVSASRGRIEIRTTNSVAVLAEELSKVVGRDVIDQTGIVGRYDLKLQWAYDDPNATAASAADTGPSIFTALEEQLGLHLEPAKGQ